MSTDLATDIKRSHHIIIAGTGRAGTSLLVKLLDACGLETSLSKGGNWHPQARAGAETQMLADGPHPYVLKSPWTYQFIEQMLDDDSIVVDEVLIPVRKLRDAAASRIINELGVLRHAVPEIDRYEAPWSDVGFTAGGAITSIEPIDQERILGRGFHILLEILEDRQIPYRLLSFPRFVNSPDYAFDRLKHLFPTISREAFDTAFSQVADTSLPRVESERESASTEQPALTELRKIEAQRNLKMTARCNEPDNAPPGLSHGDAILFGDTYAGWHWLTSYRDDDRYGIQVALSDTSPRIFVRNRIERRWQNWMEVVLSAPT